MTKALLIIDHGSTHHDANEMLEQLGDLIRKHRPGLIVKVAHMELAEPTIAQGVAACVDAGATEIIAHPYMLSPGRHATKDVPQLVQDAAAPFPGIKVKITAPLGLHDKIVDVILERANMP